MIAEEFDSNYEPSSSIPKGTTLNYILKTLKEAPVGFKKALTNTKLIKPLNENKLTQILVEQINAILLEGGIPILAQNQYSDVFYGSKGIPDFYFSKIEKGKINEPLFIVESKVLPAPPPKEREREYVIGDKNNGGIERFKSEKHGKGLDECALIGFIEKNDHDHWLKTINSWITTLTASTTQWKTDEVISSIHLDKNFAYLNSIAHKKSSDLKLHHFWIF